VSVARDLSHATPADLRTVNAGEGCPRCGNPLALGKALEVGHIFKLGTRYSETMGARVLDEAGKEVAIVMGSYGIGVERILAAAVELHHDADGIRWPMSVAPLHLALLPLQMQDAQVREVSEKLYRDLTFAGVEVLLDDRDERAGVKFKDADLIGLPLRVAVGKKGLADGKVEWKPRGAAQVELVPLGEVVARAREAVETAGGRLSR
jgi:prolyl-tRNA synthetase